jgi:hypothetical protein
MAFSLNKPKLDNLAGDIWKYVECLPLKLVFRTAWSA